MFPLPQTERQTTTKRKKTFETHLLTSTENQTIIRKSAAETERKAKVKEEKDTVVKAATKAYNAQKWKNARKNALPGRIKANPKL